MEHYGVLPTGRSLLHDEFKTLEVSEMMESVRSIDKNNGFRPFEIEANEVIDILEGLMRSLCKS